MTKEQFLITIFIVCNQALINTKCPYRIGNVSYTYNRKKIYIFHSKDIYLLLKRYIPFTQKIYTFYSKDIYLSLKRYIPFTQKIYCARHSFMRK
jgi:hypothetical protein